MENWASRIKDIRLSVIPEDVLLDLFSVVLPVSDLQRVLETLYRSVYTYSLQVTHLSPSPIKVLVMTLEGCAFTIAIWRDLKDDTRLIVAFQQNSGSSDHFCNYAIAIKNALNNKTTRFRPYHEYELPSRSDALDKLMQDDLDYNEEAARNVLLRIRELEMAKNGSSGEWHFVSYDCPPSRAWLAELDQWTDPRRINPGVALAVCRALLEKQEYKDIIEKLIEAAFPVSHPKDRKEENEVEDDTTVALKALGMNAEVVASFDPRVRSGPILFGLVQLLEEKGLIRTCLENIQQAAFHPHVAYASVRLLRVLWTMAVEPANILSAYDVRSAVEQAREFAKAHHKALETECNNMLGHYARDPPIRPIVSDYSIDSIPAVAFAAMDVDASTFVTHASAFSDEGSLVSSSVSSSLLTQRTNEANKIHDDLLERMKELETVRSCVELYNKTSFQDCVNVLRQSQNQFMRTSATANASPVKLREEWAMQWAIALSTGEDWAWALNLCRRTVLTLLYRACDLSFTSSDKIEDVTVSDQFVNVFDLKRVDEILVHCLVMDRMNALYNMKIQPTGELGLGWYSKYDEKRYQETFGVPLNPRGPTINKRLRWLLNVPGIQSDPTIRRWMEIAVPDRLQKKKSPVSTEI